MGGLNRIQHSYIDSGVDEGDPKWLQRTTNQADMFAELFLEDIFTEKMKCVDYACGAGKISEIFNMKVMKSRPNLINQIMKYEKYTNFANNPSYLSEEIMESGSFDLVTSSSVFEHLVGKQQVDNVLRLLKDNGTFCVQTLICEEVPCDPDWFYLQPVHCTLWTNRAMALFFKQCGFVGCAYNLKAQMWLMFRDRELFTRVKNRYDGNNYKDIWFFDERFIDFYKGKPYR